MKKAPAAICAAVAALSISAAASASDNEVRNAGKCSGASHSKIKVKPDDGRLEVEFEVDQNKSDEKWKVKIKDNSEVVVRDTATTHGPSGSFSLERKIDDQAGNDHVLGVAKNKSTDERCKAEATI